MWANDQLSGHACVNMSCSTSAVGIKGVWFLFRQKGLFGTFVYFQHALPVHKQQFYGIYYHKPKLIPTCHFILSLVVQNRLSNALENAYCGLSDRRLYR